MKICSKARENQRTNGKIRDPKSKIEAEAYLNGTSQGELVLSLSKEHPRTPGRTAISGVAAGNSSNILAKDKFRMSSQFFLALPDSRTVDVLLGKSNCRKRERGKEGRINGSIGEKTGRDLYLGTPWAP